MRGCRSSYVITAVRHKRRPSNTPRQRQRLSSPTVTDDTANAPLGPSLIDQEGSTELPELSREASTELQKLVDGCVTAIRREVRLEGPRGSASDEELRENVYINYTELLKGLGEADYRMDLSRNRRNGRDRARAGVPLAAVLAAYRVGVRYLWFSLVERARSCGMSDAPLVAAASRLWAAQDELVSAMTTSYRDEQQLMALAQEEERSALVQALLEGRLLDTASLWEIADVLRLGHDGPYVIVAAQLSEIGRRSLPGVEPTLHGLGISSAWRLTPDNQIGIVCLHSHSQLEQLLDVVRRVATTRVGVSPTYQRLSDTAEHLRLARIAMSSSLPKKDPVTVFNAHALAVLAVAAPEVTTRVAREVLAGLNNLPEPDRATLLDTFEVWLDSDGSTSVAAKKLFCHHNTVRHRLHRLEEQTGRSLNNPRELTELCIALENHRRFPPMTP